MKKILALTVLVLSALGASAQGTAFTYQGRLNNGGYPANGSYDLTFALFDAVSGPAQVGTTLTKSPTAVSNGLFTVTLDFGNQFPGAARWLEIGVRTNGGGFTALAPRQALTPAPYAITAGNLSGSVLAAQITGTVPLAQLPGNLVTNGQTGVTLGGTFSGNGAGLTNLNAANLTGTVPLAQLPGNLVTNGATGVNFSGTFTASGVINGGNFVWASSPGVGSYPISVTSADVNGDGKVDLISANSGVNTLTVLTNNGSGGFVLASSPGVGAGPRSVTSADVNGDGKVDLISANYTADTLTVLTNKGNGGFVLASSPVVGSFPHSVTSADVNGDGKADLINANEFGNSLTVLTNAANFAGQFIGNGSGLTSLNAANLTGTVPLAQLPGNLVTNGQTGVTLGGRFSGNGGGLTNLNAANLTGTLALAQLPGNLVTNGQTGATLGGIFSGNGGGLTNLNAANLTGTLADARLSANVSLLGNSIASAEITDGTIAAVDVDVTSFNTTFWRAAGNAGTTPGTHFLGTTDNQALELKVNGARALRLEPNTNGAPNMIGGSAVNYVGTGIFGATIAGGGAANYFGSAYSNSVLSVFSSIGGGLNNTIRTNAIYSTIGGGNQNTIQPNSSSSTIGGGDNNTIQTNASASTIGGGLYNTTTPNAQYATIPGGRENSATNYAFAAGYRAKANHTGAFVWGDNTPGDFASTSNNQFLIRAGGFVGINKNNPATALDVNGTVTATAFIGNGSGLTSLNAANLSGTVPLAQLPANLVTNGQTGVTLGGMFSAGSAAFAGAVSVVGPLQVASVACSGSAVFVGPLQVASVVGSGSAVFASGVTAASFNGAGSAALELFANGARALRLEPNASGAPNVIGGSALNYVAPGILGATIAGGGATDYAGTAYSNRVLGDFSAIGGGRQNTIQLNTYDSTIGGGVFNMIQSNSPTSTIGGGGNNLIQTNAPYATIPGGRLNSATNYAFAAGNQAKANHTGAFVWGDSFAGDVVSSAANQFTVRASGGCRIFSNSAQSAGVSLAAGGTAWAVISDRNVKKNFASVNSLQILEKLAALPITQWHYQWEDQTVTPHIGPMAQDFKAAFFPGRDDKSITTLEADGVAFAAIQGLNRKLEQKQTEITELKARLEKLERLVNEKIGGAK